MLNWVGKKTILNPKLKSKFSATLFAAWISNISHVLSSYCIWKWWMVSFCGTYYYWLSISYFFLLRVFRYFLFFLFFPSCFVSSLTGWGIEVRLEILKIKQWSYSYRFLSGVSRGELLQLHLVINVTCLVEPTEPGSVWKILVTSYLQLPVRITCCRVSPWK